MTVLTWDQVGERTFETGVDHGVLYLPDESGDYTEGYAWNGLTTVTEAPSGAAATALYADNIKYLNLISAEEFGATIAAYTYPDEFAQCDGTAEPQPGVAVGQQSRKLFGMCYRTQLGNDVEGTDHGYKLHLIYGAQAAPSQKAYGSINNNPAAIDFSWTVTTTPVPVTGFKPTSLLVIDSTKVSSADLTTLQDALYGTSGVDAHLPTPDEVIAMFSGSTTDVDLTGANAPTFTADVITLPAVTGVSWTVDGVAADPGAQPAIASGHHAIVHAEADSGYEITSIDEWEFVGS